MRGWMMIAVVPVVLSATACSGNFGPGSGGSGSGATGTNGAQVNAESMCEAACKRINECDSAKDVQTCKSSCENVNASILPKMRTETIDGMMQCFEEKDCKTVLTSSFVNTCINETAASLAPSPKAEEFCDAWAATAKKCGRTLNKAACLNLSKVYTDQTIDVAKACTAKACTDLERCISGAFGSTSSSGGSSGGSDAGASRSEG